MSMELLNRLFFVCFILTTCLLVLAVIYGSVEFISALVSKGKAWRKRKSLGDAQTPAIAEAINELKSARNLVDLEVARLERWRDKHGPSIPVPDHQGRETAQP